MTEPSFVHSVYIRTSPEHLWAAITTPALTRRYFDFIEGFMAVDSAWTPGAPVAYRTDDGQAQIEGQVLEVDAPRLLTTTLSLRYDPDLRRERPSRLRWAITAMGEVCKLTVSHDDFGGAPKTAREAAACLPAILSNLKILLETGKPRLVKAIVVDCAAPPTLATFWSAALGHVVLFADDNLSSIIDPLGLLPEIEFQRVPEPKTVKNRLHFDLQAADRAAEVERLRALGARVVQPFETWTVMTDPEGNEFCVTE